MKIEEDLSDKRAYCGWRYIKPKHTGKETETQACCKGNVCGEIGHQNLEVAKTGAYLKTKNSA